MNDEMKQDGTKRPHEAFTEATGSPTGRAANPRQVRQNERRRWRWANEPGYAERILARQAAYTKSAWAENPAFRERLKKYEAEHPEVRKKARANWEQKNPEKHAALRKQQKNRRRNKWRAKTRDSAKASGMLWSDKEDIFILTSPLSVREKALALERSTSSVEMRLWRLRKSENKGISTPNA